MTVRAQLASRHSPTIAGWWVRLFVAGVFAFYLNYVPIHLAMSAHLDDVLESVAELVFHHHHPHQHHPEPTDSDQHVPHPASDHTLTLTAQTQAQGTVAPVVCLLPTEVFAALIEPPSSPLPPIFERIRPPGVSPPDPLRPRAPPLA